MFNQTHSQIIILFKLAVYCSPPTQWINRLNKVKIFVMISLSLHQANNSLPEKIIWNLELINMFVVCCSWFYNSLPVDDFCRIPKLLFKFGKQQNCLPFVSSKFGRKLISSFIARISNLARIS